MIYNTTLKGGGDNKYTIKFTKDSNNKLTGPAAGLDITGITDIGSYVLYNKFYTDSTGRSYSNLTGPAFLNSTSLTTISGTYAIAYFAYYNTFTSTGLNNVTTISGDNACQSAFGYSTSITAANLDSLTTVSNQYACANMFNSCTNLTSLNLENLTTVTGNYACAGMFNGCTSLTTVVMDRLSLSSLYNYTFNNMFYGCTGLTSVSLKGATSIAQYTGSYGCNYMFYNCTNLQSVDLRNVTAINGAYSCSYMFSNCQKLTNVNLSSLTSISGNNACSYMFQNCKKLTSTCFSNVTTFSGNYTCSYMYSGCDSLVDTGIPATVTSLTHSGYYCTFQNCKGLKSTGLQNITSIAYNEALNSTFYGCSNLKSTGLNNLQSVLNYYACGSTFSNTKITDPELDSLETISGESGCNSMFYDNVGIDIMSFPRLSTLSSSSALNSFLSTWNSSDAYKYSVKKVYFPSLTSSSFGSYTNQFNYFLNYRYNVEVHFPVGLNSTIGSWSDITNGMNGTNTSILFDLIPSSISAPLGSVVYVDDLRVINKVHTSYTGAVPPGTTTVTAISSTNQLAQFTNDFSSTSTVSINFSNYTYYTPTISCNISGAEYVLTVNISGVNKEFTSTTGFSGTNGMTGTITARKDGYVFNSVNVTFGTTSSIVLTGTRATVVDYTGFPTDWTVQSTYASYWSTNLSEQTIVVHPSTYSSTRSTWAYIEIPIPTGVTSTTITGSSKVSSESGCDWGFMYYCSDTVVTPTGSSVPTGGTEIYRRSGVESDYTTFSVTLNTLPTNYLYLVLGWYQDYSAQGGTHSMYVKPITISWN